MSYQLNHILLTIDVEDWFQVENFKQCISFSSWQSYELRVEKNTHRLLDLLDSESTQQPFKPQARLPLRGTNRQAKRSSSEAVLQPPAKLRATFFVLGWIAQRLPHLVREIRSRGHEVASHGYQHNLCIECSFDDLKTDLIHSKNLLEDIIGDQVYGYRAPGFSISQDILKIIQDCGYLYDSSFNSFAMNGRYGHLDLSQNGTRGIALQISKIPPGRRPLRAGGQNPKSKIQNPKSKIFYELPISNIKLGNSILPWGGGGYFRLIPFPIFRLGVQSILKKENAYLLYLHPWEIDPEQPKVKEVSKFFKFRHYINLNKTASKLSSFIEAFNQCHFATCHQYLKLVPSNPQ
jgi:polysaccharide deacetylase family protein (PEP-CTERM system associated)